jgi:2-polyprenyl-3-methyl-5-hydroxy-6-metoxy-1,4-benzoquinol methylase
MDKAEYARMHALETNYWWFVGRRTIIRGFLSHLPSHATRLPLQLLDIGCGTGANLPMLREIVTTDGHVTALDFSPLALQFARTHPASNGVTLLQGDAQRLPFEDATFDVVTMLDVLEHVPDDERTLQEVWRVLRPGGSLVFSVPAYKQLWSEHDVALHHFRRYEFHALRKLLRDNQFKTVRLSFAMSLMPPLAWLSRKWLQPLTSRRGHRLTNDQDGAALPAVSPRLNTLLIKYLEGESRLLKRHRLRLGTSLVGLVQKA